MATVELLYKEEIYKIVGACIEVYRVLGFGFLEIVYKDAMQFEFMQREMQHCREAELGIMYKGILLDRKFRVDFSLFDKIIVEVKANPDGITREAIAKTLNYIKASSVHLGLLVNYGKIQMEYKRLIM